jgi:hypothetical protein
MWGFWNVKKSLSRVSAGLVWTIFHRLVQTNLSPVYVIHPRVNRAEIKLIVLWLLRHLFSVQVCFVQRNFWRIQSFRASKNYKLHNSRIFVSLIFKHKYVIYVVKRKSHQTEWSNLRIFFGKTKEFQKLLSEPCCKQILLLNINMKYFTTYEN